MVSEQRNNTIKPVKTINKTRTEQPARISAKQPIKQSRKPAKIPHKLQQESTLTCTKFLHKNQPKTIANNRNRSGNFQQISEQKLSLNLTKTTNKLSSNLPHNRRKDKTSTFSRNSKNPTLKLPKNWKNYSQKTGGTGLKVARLWMPLCSTKGLYL